MEEPRWYNSAEEYRTIQGLVREGRHREALLRAQQALGAGRPGRRQASRLHSLICWMYTEVLHQISPVAVLHGEEAVRLATQVDDPWIKCEALTRLIRAYCHMGDTARAREAFEIVRTEVEKNDGVLTGGRAGVQLLKAIIASAEGNDQECLSALERAEEVAADFTPEDQVDLRWQKISVLAWITATEKPDEARRLLAGLSTDVAALAGPRFVLETQRMVLQALLQEESHGAEARQTAKQALIRAYSAGRLDLARRCRSRLAHLL